MAEARGTRAKPAVSRRRRVAAIAFFRRDLLCTCLLYRMLPEKPVCVFARLPLRCSSCLLGPARAFFPCPPCPSQSVHNVALLFPNLCAGRGLKCQIFSVSVLSIVLRPWKFFVKRWRVSAFTRVHMIVKTGAGKVQPCKTGLMEEATSRPGECSFLKGDGQNTVTLYHLFWTKQGSSFYVQVKSSCRVDSFGQRFTRCIP